MTKKPSVGGLVPKFGFPIENKVPFVGKFPIAFALDIECTPACILIIILIITIIRMIIRLSLLMGKFPFSLLIASQILTSKAVLLKTNRIENAELGCVSKRRSQLPRLG